MSKVLPLNSREPIDDEHVGEIQRQETLDEAIWSRDQAMQSLHWDLQNVIWHAAEVAKTMAIGNVWATMHKAEPLGVAKGKFDKAMHRFIDASVEMHKIADRNRKNGMKWDDPGFDGMKVKTADEII